MSKQYAVSRVSVAGDRFLRCDRARYEALQRAGQLTNLRVARHPAPSGKFGICKATLPECLGARAPPSRPGRDPNPAALGTRRQSSDPEIARKAAGVSVWGPVRPCGPAPAWHEAVRAACVGAARKANCAAAPSAITTTVHLV